MPQKAQRHILFGSIINASDYSSQQNRDDVKGKCIYSKHLFQIQQPNYFFHLVKGEVLHPRMEVQQGLQICIFWFQKITV